MANITRNEFLDYIDAFNARDYTRQHSFYHKDVTLIIPDPSIPPLHGSEGIMKHYEGVHSLAEETIVPHVVMIDGPRIFFVMETFFRYKTATDKGVHGQHVEAGDVFKVEVWALYEMEDKKMKTITCNLYEERLLGQADVDSLVKESRQRGGIHRE